MKPFFLFESVQIDNFFGVGIYFQFKKYGHVSALSENIITFSGISLVITPWHIRIGIEHND